MISLMIIACEECFQLMVSVGNLVYISQAFGAGSYGFKPPAGPPLIDPLLSLAVFHFEKDYNTGSDRKQCVFLHHR